MRGRLAWFNADSKYGPLLVGVGNPGQIEHFRTRLDDSGEFDLGKELYGAPGNPSKMASVDYSTGYSKSDEGMPLTVRLPWTEFLAEGRPEVLREELLEKKISEALENA